MLFINLNAFAQVNGDWINSGLLKLRVNSDGQLATFNNLPASEIPAGSNNNIFKFVNLWISGYDSDNQLHISTINGFNNKTDYSQGPIDSLTYAGADPSNWNNVWNVTSSQINTHRSSLKTKITWLLMLLKIGPPTVQVDLTNIWLHLLITTKMAFTMHPKEIIQIF